MTTAAIIEDIAGRFVKPAPLAVGLDYVVTLPEYEYMPVGAFWSVEGAHAFASEQSMPRSYGAATITEAGTGRIVAEWRGGENVTVGA